MLLQHQMFLVLQDLGASLVKTMAPQTQGPMVQDHLMITETHDENLIHTPAPKMNNHDVASKGWQSESITFGKNPICECARNLSEFIAKQGPCQSCLCLKHEPNFRTSLLSIKMMVSAMQWTVPSLVPIETSFSVDREIGKQFAFKGYNWLSIFKFSSPMEMTKVFSSSHRSMLAHKSEASKIEETEL